MILLASERPLIDLECTLRNLYDSYLISCSLKLKVNYPELFNHWLKTEKSPSFLSQASDDIFRSLQNLASFTRLSEPGKYRLSAMQVLSYH